MATTSISAGSSTFTVAQLDHVAIAFVQGASRPQVAVPSRPFHQWVQPDGTLWAQFYRVAFGYLVRFPGLADFEICPRGANVVCWPTTGTSDGSIQHLYLNQVMPLARSRSGKLMFHASAVAVEDFCVAFMGMSGRGKSTLAASFATTGRPFLTDDGLSVEREGQKCYAVPSHPSIRLWEDSQLALLPPDAARAPPVQFTRKARFLAEDALEYCSRRCEIRRFYVLGDGLASTPVFEQLSPSASLIELVKNSFLLDIDQHTALASHFEELTSMVHIPMFYRMDYPRRYDALHEVRNAVIEHAAQLSRASVDLCAETT